MFVCILIIVYKNNATYSSQSIIQMKKGEICFMFLFIFNFDMYFLLKWLKLKIISFRYQIITPAIFNVNNE